MKITVSKAGLEKALALASGVAGRREAKGVRPILANTLLEVDKGALALSATDLEVGLRYRLDEVDATGAGKAVLPAAPLYSMIREMAGDTVRIEVDKRTARVELDGARYRMNGDDPEDFPGIPEATQAGGVEVPGEVLGELLRRTAFAAAKEPHRFAINGVLLASDGETLRAVATDGKRLAIAEATLAGGSGEFELLIPSRGVSFLSRVVEEGAPVRVSTEGSRAFFEAGPLLLVVRLLEGKFPDYRSVIPQGNDKSVELDAGELLRAVRSATVFGRDGVTPLRVEITEGGLRLSMLMNENESVVHCPLVAPPGDELEGFRLAFNPDYLDDFLRVAGEGGLRMEFRNASSQVSFIPGDGLQYVVMPMSLPEEAVAVGARA